MGNNEVNAFYHQVKQLTAQKIGVEGYEWKFGTELMMDIKKKNSQVFNLLNEFLSAYQKWNEFHVKIEKSENLSDEENNELTENILQRDQTRTTLIQELDK